MKYLITSVAIIGVGFLILLAQSLSNNDLVSNDTFLVLLAISVAFVLCLFFLILFQIFKLLQSVKKEITGSKLTLRLVISFGMMVLIPVLIVYLVSVNFLTKSIESWFDVRVESALEGGLTLGQNTIDILIDDIQLKGKSIAYAISNKPFEKREEILIDLREKFSIASAVLYKSDGNISAISQSNSTINSTINTTTLTLEDLTKGKSGYFVRIEEAKENNLVLKAFIPIFYNNINQTTDLIGLEEILMLSQPIPESIANVAVSVESVFEEYQQLRYSRNSLKIIYTLTLTIVLMLAILTSVAISFVISRRFTRPLSLLAEATNQIAKGNYKKIIPEIGKDELGRLVKSFNSMTYQLDTATKNSKKDRKRLEDARTFLDTTLTNLVTSIIVIDEDQKIKLYNKSAAKLLNFKLSNMIGEKLKNAIKEVKKFDLVISFIDKALKEHNESINISKEIVLDSLKEEKTLILKLSSFQESSGISYILVLDDISVVAKAQRQIAWSEIARRLAHEIKNPLTPIQLSAERVQNKIIDKLNKTDKDLLNKSTNTIIKQVDALKLMVNEFSEYSRSPTIVRKKIDITNLIDEVSYLYSDQNFTIKKNYPKKRREIRIDENKFRQVLINIFDNSKSALENIKNPRINITVKYDDNFFRLKFEDNGMGVPKDIIERIYEPYVTSKKTGTGLGLAIVYKIIEEHSGSIEIKNVNPGGAAISITLPIKESKIG
ncbi:MAG: HAMP domain-containing protein [Nitrosomonadales bacterium]|jgi:nitrogen fixation/metabolism regulation signal transduction histidine kinase|nr:HAMP domain-containing protein [Nitrosomonadales bacterium]MBT6250758.1 HAMP domain-containing protein [Nitrosomonadales bacterium]